MIRKLIFILAISSFYTVSFAGDPTTPLKLTIINEATLRMNVTASSGNPACMGWGGVPAPIPAGTTNNPTSTDLQIVWEVDNSTCMTNFQNQIGTMDITLTAQNGSACKISLESCSPPSDYENQMAWSCKTLASNPSGLCRFSDVQDNHYTVTINH